MIKELLLIKLQTVYTKTNQVIKIKLIRKLFSNTVTPNLTAEFCPILSEKKQRFTNHQMRYFKLRTERSTDEISHFLCENQLLLNKYFLVRHTATIAEHPNAEQCNFSRISLRD